MVYGRLADLVLLTHLAFIVFVALGGLAVLRWPRVAWIHLPVLAYGVAIELVGWVCPLTPIEQELRRTAGGAGYEGGFIEHYVGGVVYPTDWSRIHVWLGVALIAFNVAVYCWVLWRRRRQTAG